MPSIEEIEIGDRVVLRWNGWNEGSVRLKSLERKMLLIELEDAYYSSSYSNLISNHGIFFPREDFIFEREKHYRFYTIDYVVEILNKEILCPDCLGTGLAKNYKDLCMTCKGEGLLRKA